MVRPIDVEHLGTDRVICACEIDGTIVDPGPAASVETLLAGLAEPPRALLLTHIHLDHAGAAGVLCRRFPDLVVYVHERGAPHLADPSRLISSASRLYGEENMERLWGEIAPVPDDRIRPLSGGETVEGFRVAYTPGHASHHVCYLREETGDAFVGDMAGNSVPPSGFVYPPTPPPDIDVEAWVRSLALIARWEPSALWVTHFGRVEGVAERLAAVEDRLHEWAALARETDAERFVSAIEEQVRGEVAAPEAERLLQAAPPVQLHLGLERYWRKRAERDGAAA